ncbi:MAG: 4-hydroxythreonine-4-phosphate dehydrogenase PdxA [Anaerolineales bacterium]
MNDRPLIVISMGDPAGIGPEIALKAAIDPGILELCRPVIIGDVAALQTVQDVSGVAADLHTLPSLDTAGAQPNSIDVVDLANIPHPVVSGQVSPTAGQAAFEYITRGAALCLEGEADALVTGPINKEAIQAAGYKFQGHTEILAAQCNVRDVAMMLVAGQLRVSHVTTHVSLRQACDLIRKERVLQVLSLTHEMLGRLGISNPHLAVAGLNPHAGESGLFGHEEIEEIIPAVEAARAKGMQASGPYPPDTIFLRAAEASDEPWADAVIAMYHDQGHIPVKLLGFHDGVNVTLGLPIIRTSVDHGTAFDIAGKGEANPASLMAALRFAARLSRGRSEQGRG